MAGGLTKYIITGHIIEIYKYKSYFHGKGGNTGTKKGCADLENKLKNYASTNQRRRDTIRRLACCNFNNKYDKFLTLTFADNMTDIQECNVLFKAFIRKLKSKYNKDLKYLAVIEFQQRGAVHYHVLLNIPYIPHKELQELWGNGFVFINAIEHVDNIGAYVLKQLSAKPLSATTQVSSAPLISIDQKRRKPYNKGTCRVDTFPCLRIK